MHTKGQEGNSVCRHCGTVLTVPLCFGADAPVAWEALTVDERGRRGNLTLDLCDIDGQHFFVRGRLQLSIQGADQVFTYLVWSSLSKSNYQRTRDLWGADGREREPPYFGWLNSALPGYPSTVSLKVKVHTQPAGQRPLIELEPTEHPLAIEQREGITWTRVHDLVDGLAGYGA
jgi:hypothetical protein